MAHWQGYTVCTLTGIYTDDRRPGTLRIQAEKKRRARKRPSERHWSQPVKAKALSGAPRDADTHQACPVTTDTHQACPVTTDTHQACPVTTDTHQACPVTTDTHQACPVTTDTHQACPVTTDTHQACPVTTHLLSIFQTRAGQQRQTSGKQVQRQWVSVWVVVS